MRNVFLLMAIAVVCSWTVGSAEAQDILNPDNNTPDCIATWDPFCPRGTGSDGGGGGGTPFICQYCKFTRDFTYQCASVAVGDTGMSECTNSSDGLNCTLSGISCGSV